MRAGLFLAAGLLIAAAALIVVENTKRPDSVQSSTEGAAAPGSGSGAARPEGRERDSSPRELVAAWREANGPDNAKELRRHLKAIRTNGDAVAWLKVFPELMELFGVESAEVKAAVFAIGFHLEDPATAMELASDHLDGEQLEGLSSMIVAAATSREETLPRDLHLRLKPGSARNAVVGRMAVAFASQDPQSLGSWIEALPLADERNMARTQAQAQLQHQIIETGDPASYSALASLLESGGSLNRTGGEARAIAQALKGRRPVEELRQWAESFSDAGLRAQVGDAVGSD